MSDNNEEHQAKRLKEQEELPSKDRLEMEEELAKEDELSESDELSEDDLEEEGVPSMNNFSLTDALSMLLDPNMQPLTTPMSGKGVECIGDQTFRVTAMEMQGFRRAHEDNHAVCLSLKNHPSFTLFAVFDGHAGTTVSNYLSTQLVVRIDGLSELSDESIKNAVLNLDKEFNERFPEAQGEGSTLLMALLERKADSFAARIFNLGDSRALLLKNDGNFLALSKDHKPNDEVEKMRIEAAGGVVEAERVDGNLAMSRAFGDHIYKENTQLDATKQKVIALGDIVHQTIEKGEILLLACDGIYETLEWSQVAGALRTAGVGNEDPVKVLKELFDLALETGSTDNMTGVLVELVSGIEHAKRKKVYFAGQLYNECEDEEFMEMYMQFARKFAGEDVTEMQIKRLSFAEDICTLERKIQVIREAIQQLE